MTLRRTTTTTRAETPMKKLLLAGLALCQGLTLTSLAAAADLTIGGLIPMSGSNAEYGQIFSSGANLAVEHINASKMLSGKLSIVYEDSQGLPMQGVIGMNKLVNVAKEIGRASCRERVCQYV